MLRSAVAWTLAGLLMVKHEDLILFALTVVVGGAVLWRRIRPWIGRYFDPVASVTLVAAHGRLSATRTDVGAEPPQQRAAAAQLHQI